MASTALRWQADGVGSVPGFGSPVPTKTVICGHSLVTLPFTMNDGVETTLIAVHLNAGLFSWWQYSVRYSACSDTTPTHTPPPPPPVRPACPEPPNQVMESWSPPLSNTAEKKNEKKTTIESLKIVSSCCCSANRRRKQKTKAPNTPSATARRQGRQFAQSRSFCVKQV